MIRLRYRASLDLWWRNLRDLEKQRGSTGPLWTGPFATAQGALRLALNEDYTDQQRAAWRARRY